MEKQKEREQADGKGVSTGSAVHAKGEEARTKSLILLSY
jgi:hypothetical protein